MSEVARLRSIGYNAWFDQQFAEPTLDTHWGYVTRMGPVGCSPCNSRYINAFMESFWKQAVQGRDQLRQRVTFALTELFVTSNNDTLTERPLASYVDTLSQHAFGNFRQLLEAVTRHPSMGHYLTYIHNEKEDPVTGRVPDENYARELMQLFTIGLWQLNDDGTHRKDSAGRDIPTYGLFDVVGLARVMTGLSWANQNFGERHGDYGTQMRMHNQHHSTGEKRFLGVTIPASSSANGDADLRIALDTLFNHPNVGPFIGKQLIKRFVTSNPSPAYVQRVARAFNGEGGRVRGDMRAVIKAVLMDPEARDAAKLGDPHWGKLREPIMRIGNYMRAFNVSSSNGIYALWNLEDPVSSIGQNPLRAPSVFNWFRPDYSPPGDIVAASLTAPEFQITHETTLTGYNNTLDYLTFRDNIFDAGLRADYSAEVALAGQPDALLNRLNILLMAGQLSTATRESVRAALTSTSDPNQRVRLANRLLMASPEYIVQK